MRVLCTLALLIAAALNLSAQDGPYTVRLYSQQEIKKARIVPGTETWLRRCDSCGPERLKQPLELLAHRLGVKYDDRTSEKLVIFGDYRLEPDKRQPLTLDQLLKVESVRGSLRLILTVPAEKYVEHVVAGEAGGLKSLEALKAMAVAARSYASHNRGRHRQLGYDFCDTTHCQDVRFDATQQRIADTVAATQGEMLMFEGKPIAAYYHAHCGGKTESAGDVWLGAGQPYLKSQADQYCARKDPGSWRAEIGRGDLREALNDSRLHPPRNIEDIEIVSRTPSGRVKELRLSGSNSMTLVAGRMRFAIGRSLGWNLLRSDDYEVRRSGDAFVFTGKGRGHGVGLCQIGADEMAASGKDYKQILSFYYPGTELKVSKPGPSWQAVRGERVELMSENPSVDAAVLELAEKMLPEVEKRTGLASRRIPKLVIFPTLDSYRDMTGQPGWVAANTRIRNIRMQPVATLRRKGVLEQTLRHELLHFLLEQHTARTVPLWFREGLVLHFNGEQVAAGEFGSTAELERALKAPASQDELMRAYGAAYARVNRLIEQHGEKKAVEWLGSGVPD